MKRNFVPIEFLNEIQARATGEYNAYDRTMEYLLILEQKVQDAEYPDETERAVYKVIDNLWIFLENAREDAERWK